MRLLIFGATGTMGVLLAREFLLHPCVIPIQGTLEEIHNISKAMEGVNAVITALGPTGRKGPFYPSNTPIAAAYDRIIATMRVHGVRRLIALTTPSVRDPADQFSLPLEFLRRTFATLTPNVVKDIRAVGTIVRTQAADLDWTLVRLALHSSSDGGNYDIVAGYVGDGKTRVELEKRQWVRKAPILSAP
ncbi:NAD-P-binding protein [Mycena latifolia]|nr:NAD-P-binding protein [Mycena latifolia]